MAKAGVLERDGEILEVLPAGKYTVKLKDTDIIKQVRWNNLISQWLNEIM